MSRRAAAKIARKSSFVTSPSATVLKIVAIAAGYHHSLAIMAASCRPDFNGSGMLDSQDFIDYLSAFFAEDPSADFNDDGGISSQDFFDFSTAFFTGC